MRIIDGFWETPRLDRPTVLTFGKFDALHLGHRDVFQSVLDRARADGVDAAVLFLHPNPLKLIAPERCPASLTSHSQKLRAFEEMGFDLAIVGRFDERLREFSAQDFLARVVDAFRARVIAVGYSVRFGHEGRGDIDMLREQADLLGYEAVAGEAHMCRGEAISSTRIRDAIARADFDLAEDMLGRPYALTGVVVEGNHMGRELGFPTANVDYGDMQLPPEGIYAAHTIYGGTRYPSAVSLGKRPTFDGTQLLLESYLLDFSADLYGQEVDIEFVQHLRDQEKFASVDKLVARIRDDVRRTREATRLLAPLSSGSSSAMHASSPSVRIRRLIDVPNTAPTLVEWLEREWASYFGPDGPGDAEADLRAGMDGTPLPVCLVAIDAADTAVGTVTLRARSFSHGDLTPWVGALLVVPSRRRQGFGTALVAACEDEARRLGYGKLYMSTDAANSIAEGRGWRAFDVVESSRGPVTCYELDL